MRVYNILKKRRKKVFIVLILITIGITFFQIERYNTVKAGGQVRNLKLEKFWSGDRFYLTLENDNGKVREYKITEKDYYRLKDGQYIIIFMDGHIETLKEFKKSNRSSINNLIDNLFLLSISMFWIYKYKEV